MIKIEASAVICTALLQLRNGHVEAAGVTLGDHIDEAVQAGEEPNLTVMCAADWLNKGFPIRAKQVLSDAIAPLPGGRK